jgi:hypothetical protein
MKTPDRQAFGEDQFVVNTTNPIDPITAPIIIAKISTIHRSASRDNWGVKIATASAVTTITKAKRVSGSLIKDRRTLALTDRPLSQSDAG